ncbi:hypothetical protein NL529_32585, partial [Klebsiella pneumoniae]|nr:hypothetical protein [Klebsiella pneumoniae]
LQNCQSALEQAYPGTIKIIWWSPLTFWRTLSCCKLYDYHLHQWVDFRGNPTSPQLIIPRINPIENAELPAMLADG